MGRVRLGLGGLAIAIALSSCGQPTVPLTMAPDGGGFTTQQAGLRRRPLHCDRRTGERMARQVADRLVRQALNRYNLQNLTNQRDIDRAQGDLAQFLVLKLGGPQNVCEAFSEGGVRRLRRELHEEAAAMLLGVMHLRQGVPTLEVPFWFQPFIRRQSQGQSQPAIMGALRDLGLSRHLAFRLAREIVAARVYGDRAIVRIPYRFDLEAPFVFAATQAKRAYYHGGYGTNPWQRLGSRADRYGSYTRDFGRFGQRQPANASARLTIETGAWPDLD